MDRGSGILLPAMMAGLDCWVTRPRWLSIDGFGRNEAFRMMRTVKDTIWVKEDVAGPAAWQNAPMEHDS